MRPNSPPVRIQLEPVVVAVPIEVILSALSMEFAPAQAEIVAGEIQAYAVTVRDGEGHVVADPQTAPCTCWSRWRRAARP